MNHNENVIPYIEIDDKFKELGMLKYAGNLLEVLKNAALLPVLKIFEDIVGNVSVDKIRFVLLIVSLNVLSNFHHAAKFCT